MSNIQRDVQFRSKSFVVGGILALILMVPAICAVAAGIYQINIGLGVVLIPNGIRFFGLLFIGSGICTVATGPVILLVGRRLLLGEGGCAIPLIFAASVSIVTTWFTGHWFESVSASTLILTTLLLLLTRLAFHVRDWSRWQKVIITARQAKIGLLGSSTVCLFLILGLLLYGLRPSVSPKRLLLNNVPNVTVQREMAKESVRLDLARTYVDYDALAFTTRRRWLAIDENYHAVGQSVTKRPAALGARLRYDHQTKATGDGKWTPVSPREPYQSAVADTSYLYCHCGDDPSRAGSWGYLALYGQYTVELTYFGEEISAKEFKELARSVDNQVREQLVDRP